MSSHANVTPIKTALAAPVTDSPGTWRHPRLDEITRRRNATTFTEKNIRRIAYNLVALLVIWSLQLLARPYVNPQIFPASLRPYVGWVWLAAKLVPFVQIGLACLPLLRKEDDLADIPLTATQRKLLGLPPSSAPPTPDAKFSTPPRYSRTPSIAGSVGSRASYSSSPLSGRGSPAMPSPGGFGAAYSPPSSPLMHKTGSGLGDRRRSSIGSPGPFGASTSASLFSDSGSSNSGGKRTSVALNSKWLYEKGRRSSGSAWLH
ncbi:nuclear pore complex component-domain-containing protein [Stachybotrys elegans]|uniref:Nuclear pore complex component-domain-containing protein n=1 Tax=Stachybotrys elegans TaxID=80388 RepID=A0A8K0SV16_9HYPO|nr:nuclear pore complex component-domain-containing protein [Stachybotrys elegans]